MKILLLLVIASAVCAGARAAPAHEHGLARLDVAVEAARVTLDLQVPLDSLLGFEHAPRNDAERRRAEAAVARLRAAGELFRIDGAAGCELAKVTLVAPALGLGGAAGDKEGHADLDGRFEFACKAGARAGQIEVGLFEAFAGLRRIELQVATPKGQMKATLVRPASRVALVR
jgi:hypothetical protein